MYYPLQVIWKEIVTNTCREKPWSEPISGPPKEGREQTCFRGLFYKLLWLGQSLFYLQGTAPALPCGGKEGVYWKDTRIQRVIIPNKQDSSSLYPVSKGFWPLFFCFSLTICPFLCPPAGRLSLVWTMAPPLSNRDWIENLCLKSRVPGKRFWVVQLWPLCSLSSNHLDTRSNH